MKISHLNNLRALEAVLRTGGLRPAAAELGVTPAAVGQQIRTLEVYLGTTLLDRSANGAIPNKVATQVSDSLTRHIAGLADILAELQAPKSSNRISISMLALFAEVWFPRHLGSLFAQIPNMDLRLDMSETIVDLHSGEFDFAIRHMGVPSNDFESIALFSDQSAPVCTPKFAKRYQLGPETKSLKDVPLADVQIMSNAPVFFDMKLWCEHFDILPPDANSGMMRTQNTAGHRMTSAGLTLYLGDLVESLPDLTSGRLILPFGPTKVALGSFMSRLIWRKDMRLSPIQRNFVDWMATRATKDREAVARFLTQ